MNSDATRALVIVAHPDDAEFWAGGAVAQWCAEGIEVSYLVLTDGDAGGLDPSVARSKLPETRRAEQRKAAAILGVRDVVFMGWTEGTLSADLQSRREVVRVVRATRPHRVITWTPEWNWSRFRSSCHIDHRGTGELALSSLYPDAGNPHAHVDLMESESLEPWTVPEIWLINGTQPNRYVDITDVFEKKLEALRAHSSQTQNDQLAKKMRAWMQPNAQRGGLPAHHVAEVFQVVVNE